MGFPFAGEEPGAPERPSTLPAARSGALTAARWGLRNEALQTTGALWRPRWVMPSSPARDNLLLCAE